MSHRVPDGRGQREAFRTGLAAVLLGIVLILPGCSRERGRGPAGEDASLSPAGSVDARGEPGTEAVATLGTRRITAKEADAAIAAALIDLDYQRYLLRRDATVALLLAELTAPGSRERSARLLLVPPRAAAVELTGEPAAVRPERAAPVTVTVFCNLQSPHCANLQPEIADLRSLFPGQVRIAARDLPLPIHPHSALAAEAARCAGRQGRYWNFHDLRWARDVVPDRAGLDELARAAGLDLAAFAKCLDGRSERQAVEADRALAQRLGLAAVPAVFVNGRPAMAPVTPDQLAWMVSDALGSAALPPVADAPPTALPFVLRATIVGEQPGLGMALVGGLGSQAPVALRREGERIAPGAILRRVAADHVELLVEGRVERLGTIRETAPASGGNGPGEPASARGAEDAELQAARATLPRADAMAVYLDRELVRERMTDRVALSAALAPVEMTVDGYRLLRLDQTTPGDLYGLLGLQAGDVIVMVNERPIHEGDNPLWDALDREREVRLRVMRKGGIARHYTYRFE